MAKTQEELDKEASMGCADPTRALLMTRPAFGGNIMATLMCPRTKPQMATVRPGVMKRIDKDESRKGELLRLRFHGPAVQLLHRLSGQLSVL